MMLGAAKLLKSIESDIQGQVKLMFQPAEETLAGAKSMIAAGILEAPTVDAAMMIHVMTGFPLPAGKVIVSQAGLTAAASDWFEIHVQGKGGHGAMPNTAVDPINAATHIFQALQSIHSREIAPGQAVALTIGKFVSGTTSNVIPDTAHMYGTLRTYEPETRTFVRERMEAIAKATAEALRATAEVKIIDGCPALNNDGALVDSAKQILNELLPASELLDMSVFASGGRMSGSEDFAYVSEKVPSLMLGLSAGDAREGFSYPQHHPKAIFDECVLSKGAAVYAYTAVRWLACHTEA
jgi:hippurate hydrolase